MNWFEIFGWCTIIGLEIWRKTIIKKPSNYHKVLDQIPTNVSDYLFWGGVILGMSLIFLLYLLLRLVN